MKEKILGIESIKIKNIDDKNKKQVTIEVESNEDHVICSKCHRKVNRKDGHEKTQLIRHLPIFSKTCFLKIAPQRYRCHCGTVNIENYSWKETHAQSTKDFENKILLQLINSTIEDVSLKEELGYDQVLSILERKMTENIDLKKTKKSILLESMKLAY